MNDYISRFLVCIETSLSKIFTLKSKVAYKYAYFLLIFEIILIVILLFMMGCSHQWTNPWDSSCLLDGGWRVLNGQKPHIDFASPIGIIYHLIIMLGMKIAGPTGKSLTIGPLIIYPFITMWAWVIAKRRLTVINAFLFASWSGIMIVATHRLDWTFNITTYALQYNRFGWSLIGIVFLQLLLPPRCKLSYRLTIFEYISTGIILVLLLFIKITYFALSVPAVILYFIFFRGEFQRWIWMVISFITLFFVVLVYLDFNLLAFINDLRMLAGVHNFSSRILHLFSIFRKNFEGLGLLLIIGFLLIKPMIKQDLKQNEYGWIRFALISSTIAFCGLVICSTNWQKTNIPLFALAGLIMCEDFHRRFFNKGNSIMDKNDTVVRHLWSSFISIYMISAILIPDAGSVAYSFAWKMSKADKMPQSARIQSKTMQDMIFPPNDKESRSEQSVMKSILDIDPNNKVLFTPFQYVYWVNNGLTLLRKHISSDSIILSMDSYNPFSFALELQSPRGDMHSWTYGYLNDEYNSPKTQVLFQDATHVMVPKRSYILEWHFKLRMYGDYIEKHFDKIDESELWILYNSKDKNPI